MIIVSMGGGLGNQMFEYAFYLQLKTLYPNEEIKVDTRYVFPVSHNGIELFDIFGIIPVVATKEDVLSLTKGYKLYGEGFSSNTIIEKILRRIKNKFQSAPDSMRIQEDFTEFSKIFLSIDENQSVYFYGPFANYHYFSEIEEVIKETYLFPTINDKTNKKYKHEIEQCNSVSIHIRRGDYITEGVELAKPEFYKKALDIMEDKVDSAKYFVFTDDKEYARELFSDAEKFVIVEGNSGKDSFRDMQLMSLCKHNITANSSFSFWGAFLNRNKDKIVVSPNQAFTGCKYPFVCDDWILL